MIDDVAAHLEAGHDAGVGRYAVAIFSCLEGLDENGVCIAGVGHHQVLIAAAGEDREAACVVRVERADGFYPYVKFSIGLGMCFVAGGRGGEGGRTRLGGADALFGWCEMAFGGFLAVGTVY